jgi:hypothetical protein
MKPATRYIAFVVVLAATFPGCRGLPSRDLDEYVGEADVVGTWRLTDASLRLLRGDGFVTSDEHLYQITFRADGHCLYSSVLIASDPDEYVNVEGRWELEHDTTGDSNIVVKNAVDLRLDLGDGGYHGHLHFHKRDGRLILWEFHTDPDAWEFVEYEKIEADPLVSGYKSNNDSWLQNPVFCLLYSESQKACKMGVFSKIVTLRICRIV